jgi:hypothetical protein
MAIDEVKCRNLPDVCRISLFHAQGTFHTKADSKKILSRLFAKFNPAWESGKV